MRARHIIPILLIASISVAASVINPVDKTIAVRVEKVQLGSVQDLIVANGTIELEKRVSISPYVSARVVKVFVKEGELVNKGDILATLDSTDELTKLQSRMSDYEIQKLQTEKASIDLKKQVANQKRLSSMLQSGHINISQFEESQHDLRVAEINLLEAKQREKQLFQLVEEQKEILTKVNIVAPFNGLITSVDALPGEYVIGQNYYNNGSNLFGLASIENSFVDVSLTQAEVAKVSIGQEVKIFPSAYRDNVLMGSIAYINPIAKKNNTSGHPMFSVKVQLPKLPRGLLSGMTCRAEIVDNQNENSLHVPIAAVVRTEENPFVWLVTEKGKIEKRFITLAESSDVSQIIKTGILEGENVVVGPLRLMNQLEPGKFVEMLGD